MWSVVALVLLLGGCAQERARPEPGVSGRIHPLGILEEDSELFHGKELARRDYDFSLCAKCHGDDFAGGASGVSCLECHDDGPTACATCHREDIEQGAHAIHRTNQVTCGECHVVPDSWASEGHIRRGGKADPRPAEVVFGSRAGAAATFADGTCTSVYCHGSLLTGGTATSPRWDEPATGGCDRCHGAPPPSHAQTQCASCHPADAPHVDGVIDIGRTSGCDGCHGSDGDPTPTSGAHRAHMTVPTGLRTPLSCSDCHATPAAITAPGHIDSPLPAEVLPAVGWTGTTCGTWCHGGTSPAWTAQGPVTCGSCHAVPPASAAHAGVTSVQSCPTCHPSTGHMDGDVDVF